MDEQELDTKRYEYFDAEDVRIGEEVFFGNTWLPASYGPNNTYPIVIVGKNNMAISLWNLRGYGFKARRLRKPIELPVIFRWVHDETLGLGKYVIHVPGIDQLPNRLGLETRKFKIVEDLD
jgi:hypothetical protein